MTDIWLHRFALFTSFSTMFLIYWGGLVTSTGSGLAVPDWPLSYGMLMPPMVGGIFYEHGHRMIATFVGLLTIILAIWLQRKEPRKWVRVLGWTALGTVVFQGILGGITVLFFLPTAVSVFHAMLAQSFFTLTAAIALFTSPLWKRTTRHSLEPYGQYSLRSVTVVLTLSVLIQLFLGAVMRHMGAGLAIPDFPLAFGRLIPSFESAEIAVHFLHRVGAVIVSGMVIWYSVKVQKYYRNVRILRFSAYILLTLVTIQVLLGSFVIWTAKPVSLTTMHVVTGALILATSGLSTLLAHRMVRPVTAGINLSIASHT